MSSDHGRAAKGYRGDPITCMRCNGIFRGSIGWALQGWPHAPALAHLYMMVHGIQMLLSMIADI